MKFDVSSIETRHFNRLINKFAQVFSLLIRDRKLFLPAFRWHVRIGEVT